MLCVRRRGEELPTLTGLRVSVPASPLACVAVVWLVSLVAVPPCPLFAWVAGLPVGSPTVAGSGCASLPDSPRGRPCEGASAESVKEGNPAG